LLALSGAHHILHVSRERIKTDSAKICGIFMPAYLCFTGFLPQDFFYITFACHIDLAYLFSVLVLFIFTVSVLCFCLCAGFIIGTFAVKPAC
jgi:hypothetical protein